MHNTSTAGIFGAVAAIAVLKKLPSTTIGMAFGLAGSKAAGSMQYLENGSWNKRLHPGFAVHDAFVCVALAESGVIGATKALEGKLGFLQAYSPKAEKNLGLLTQNLGSEWTFLKSSLKPYPACRMTHGFIEMAGDMGQQEQQHEAELSRYQTHHALPYLRKLPDRWRPHAQQAPPWKHRRRAVLCLLPDRQRLAVRIQHRRRDVHAAGRPGNTRPLRQNHLPPGGTSEGNGVVDYRRICRWDSERDAHACATG